MNEILFFTLILFLIPTTLADRNLLEGIYCGSSNCYDVLGATRDSSKLEISRNYRKLAKKFHPDLHKGDEAKKVAEEEFKRIATAYEILKDDEARADYDYMLDNPDKYYAHYYRYYRRRVAPKVDVRIVVITTIIIVTLIQYYSSKQKYETAIKYFMTVPKYRNKAMEIIREQDECSSIASKKAHKKANKSKSKEEQREEQERQIRKVIEENLDIKGSYAKPEIIDLLIIQILILPYTIVIYLKWYLRWIWKFYVMKNEYGEEEKLYLIRKNMALGQHQFNSIEEEKIIEYLAKELWIKDNFKRWKIDQDEEMKKQLADNNRYKAYRRYMKKNGPGRITFDE